jgi:hypothetical protein
MGWFDDLFTNKQKTQSTSSSSVADPELQKFRELLERARDLSYDPYQAYTGERVAGLGADFDAASDAIYGAQDQADPWFNAAYSSAQAGAAPVTWQQVQEAYSPYIDNQVRTLQDDFAYQNDIAQQRARTTSTNAGVITGDRARVAETLTEDSQRRSQDPQIAAIRAQAGDRAWQGAEGNRDAARAGAQVYGQLGGQAQDSAYKNVEGLMGLAGARQQNNQANLDWNYQNDYANAQAYPYQNMSWYGQFLGMAPGMATQSTGTSIGSTQTGLGNVAAGIGSAALGGWLGSDERIKENIVPIGKAHDGQTIYRYNYVGDPTTHIGFIAQEVEESHPEAVAEGPDGIKMVNYDLATRDAAPDMPHKMQEGGFAYGGSVEARMGPSEFDKLVGKVDTAVRSLRGHMQGGRAGYSSGGPTIFTPPSASGGYVGVAGGYIPEGKGLSVSPLPAAQAPELPADTSGSDMQQWSEMGASLGKWLGKKSTDPTDPASWKTTVTRNPNYDRGGSVAGFGLSEDDPLSAFVMPPVDYAENSSMSPMTVKQSRPSGVPGLSFDGAPPQEKAIEKTYSAKPISTMGDAYAPPLQSEAPSLPEMDQSAGVAPTPSSAKERAWYEPIEGKEWYEFGSNPELGLALATAASGFFGPNGGPGRALATGIGTYLSRADNERKQLREDREADMRAAQFEGEAETRRLNRQKAQFEMDEAKRGKVYSTSEGLYRVPPSGPAEKLLETSSGKTDDTKEFDFAVANGYKGNFMDFMRDRSARTSETTLTREEAKKAVNTIDRYRQAADASRGGLSDVAQMRALRDGVGYEGGYFDQTRTAVGRNVGDALGFLPFIPSSEEAANAEAIASKATEMQLNFTNETKGAISDAEMRLFGTATPGMDMSDPAADKILAGMEAGHLRTIERAKFYDAYLRQNKTISGADEAWDTYINANPVLIIDPKTKEMTVNKQNIGNWKSYIGSQYAPGDIVDGWQFNGGDDTDKSNWTQVQ